MNRSCLPLLCCLYFLSVLHPTMGQVSLLKNKKALVPLPYLEERNIASLVVGDQDGTDFTNTLNLYKPVETLQLGDNDLEELLEKSEPFNTLIVAWMGPERPSAAWLAFFELAQKQSDLFICTFGLGPYSDLSSDVWIHSVQTDSVAQSQAAQLIFAGEESHLFPPIRLSYASPEAVGWDGNLLERKMDSIINRGIREQAFPGCQVLVAKDRKVVFHKAYGFHTYDSARAVRLTDMYDLASVTKVTGPLPALMKLHGEGDFVLDNILCKYWPDLRGSNKRKIIVRDVLAHQARLKPYIVYWEKTVKRNGRFKNKTFSTDSSALYPIRVSKDYFLYKDYHKKIFKYIRRSPLNPEPGYVYSGLTFLMYPTIIEMLTGRKYDQYLREEFYDKIGAHRLGFNPYQRFSLNEIVPTEYDSLFRKQLVHGYVHDEAAAMLGGLSGNAGLFSNANDLAKLLQMYMNMGSYSGQELIPSSSVEAFTSYQFPRQGNRRGLGFDKPMLENKERGYVAPSASASSFGHSGFTGTFAWADPDHDLLFIFLSNRVYPTRANRKLYSLNIRPSMHQLLYDQIEQAVPLGTKRSMEPTKGK